MRETFPPVSFDNWLEHALPANGAVDVARTQSAAFQIAELVEYEERMITGAVIVTFPDAHLLFAVRRAHALIHVEDDALRWMTTMNAVNPLARKIGEGG